MPRPTLTPSWHDPSQGGECRSGHETILYQVCKSPVEVLPSQSTLYGLVIFSFASDTRCAGMSSLRENCWVWHMACRWHAHNTQPQNIVDQEKGRHIHKTKWLLAIMCLEDQRLKQAYCDSDRFQVSPFGVL